jgi:hypothetical protein
MLKSGPNSFRCWAAPDYWSERRDDEGIWESPPLNKRRRRWLLFPFSPRNLCRLQFERFLNERRRRRCCRVPATCVPAQEFPQKSTAKSHFLSFLLFHFNLPHLQLWTFKAANPTDDDETLYSSLSLSLSHFPVNCSLSLLLFLSLERGARREKGEDWRDDDESAETRHDESLRRVAKAVLYIFKDLWHQITEARLSGNSGRMHNRIGNCFTLSDDAESSPKSRERRVETKGLSLIHSS